MFRNDNTAGAVNAYMTVDRGPGCPISEFAPRRARRQYGTPVSGIPPPVWVKVVRSSDLFSGYYSLDGTNWIQVGSTATIEMTGTGPAGLAVTAHNNAALNTSTFTNVSMPSTTFGIYRRALDQPQLPVWATL